MKIQQHDVDYDINIEFNVIHFSMRGMLMISWGELQKEVDAVDTAVVIAIAVENGTTIDTESADNIADQIRIIHCAMYMYFIYIEFISHWCPMSF